MTNTSNVMAHEYINTVDSAKANELQRKNYAHSIKDDEREHSQRGACRIVTK